MDSIFRYSCLVPNSWIDCLGLNNLIAPIAHKRRHIYARYYFHKRYTGNLFWGISWGIQIIINYAYKCAILVSGGGTYTFGCTFEYLEINLYPCRSDALNAGEPTYTSAQKTREYNCWSYMVQIPQAEILRNKKQIDRHFNWKNHDRIYRLVWLWCCIFFYSFIFHYILEETVKNGSVTFRGEKCSHRHLPAVSSSFRNSIFLQILTSDLLIEKLQSSGIWKSSAYMSW